MPFAACQTQTLNKNNKDTHYKNKHPHPPHPTTKTNSAEDTAMRAMLASTIQYPNNKRPPPQHPTIRPGPVLMSQNPNSVLETRPPPAPEGSTPTPPTAGTGSTTQTRTKGPAFVDGSTIRTPPTTPPNTRRRRPPTNGGCVLLRKEVIQPHLPVRLPCYDFVPIASPTFDHSPPQVGWAMGFGCCRLS